MTVQVHGLDALVRQLKAMPEQLQDVMRRVVKESAADVQRETLLNVRRDTGKLQNDLATRYTDGGLRAEVGWFNRTDFYAWFNEVGTKSIPAKPALGPAIEGERNRIRDRAVTEINKAIKDLGRSGGGR
ncbi:HK97 gp10 family phage protein [Kitasatospora purpeofusca]|uniref:HK97-gp10 family putative phage morphogenesis protein n=1 Tax=Kitasatospora purpeofusca TaxID=67352 RepID=UPI00224D0BE4|nr:HK97-gp10 family putative phage morphogenesis protein [Kitasatospora purpeofusca]MCX4686764.1 HK97 gp10 family phage protein [Kitasatospora purpeofusca]